ncbi:LppU/SCO3897 family protein [Glycomyces buryatensis]|uniref:Uncharacterized protein n=1 Tax=Glycomyces buryatensis TaxID=2570927 RepID=A0A4S8Q3D7_9ACTN|nr:hypothetical protein [Glycomyces buryatensis]THV34684.1 hypothetical protein FAB82_23840 [Glycomyces buryatensis]
MDSNDSSYSSSDSSQGSSQPPPEPDRSSDSSSGYEADQDHRETDRDSDDRTADLGRPGGSGRRSESRSDRDDNDDTVRPNASFGFEPGMDGADPQPEMHVPSEEAPGFGFDPDSGLTADVPVADFTMPVPGDSGTGLTTVLGLTFKGWAAIVIAAATVLITGVALSGNESDADTGGDDFSSTDLTDTDPETDEPWTEEEETEPLDPVEAAVVGDCFVDYGDEYSADIEPTSCGAGSFETVDIFEGTSDLASCDSVENANKAVTSTAASRVLCLSYIAIDGDDAYQAQVDECVYGPNETGSAWGTIGCEDGAFRVLERLEGQSDMGMCSESTYYNHAISYTTSETYLDVVLCLQMIYPGGDIGYAEMDHCMSMTGDYEYFEFVSDCSSGNVYLTGRTSEDVDSESWCNGWGWYNWTNPDFPEHTFTACWGWL